MNRTSTSLMEKMKNAGRKIKARLQRHTAKEQKTIEELYKEYLRSLPVRLRTTGFTILSRTVDRTSKIRPDTGKGAAARRRRQIERGQLTASNGLCVSRRLF